MTDDTAPSPYSAHNPRLQLAWDATSLGKFMEDPATYYLTHIEGWRPQLPPAALVWGKIYHASLEERDKLIASGKSRAEALDAALHYAWEQCAIGEDGMSMDELADLSSKKGDNTRRTTANMLRSLIWYDAEFGGLDDDPVRTVVFEDGTPGVELSFRMPLPITSPYGEPYILCGHMDGVVEYEGSVYVRERKHTTSSLGSWYAKRFSPNTQISTYALASRIVLPEQARGVMVEAAQLAVGFTRFDRFFAPRTARQVDEWLADAQFWIKQAEHCAETGNWPINQSTQMLYGGSAMRGIFAKDPAVREQHLKMAYKKGEPWNPLAIR